MNDELRRMIREQAEKARAGGWNMEIAPEVVLELLLQLDQLQARLDGLNLAATQYSESRDRWFIAARQAEADAAAWLAFVREAARQLEGGADPAEIQSALYDAVRRAEVDGPGTALLAELAAAHALREALAALVGDGDGLYPDDGGLLYCAYCAAEPVDSAPDAAFEHTPDCPIRRGREALADYDRARKARDQP